MKSTNFELIKLLCIKVDYFEYRRKLVYFNYLRAGDKYFAYYDVVNRIGSEITVIWHLLYA